MNNFDQSGVQEQQGLLRPTLKKPVTSLTKLRSNISVTVETKRGSLANLSSLPAEEKKVDFAIDTENNFLNKLTSTVKKIEQFHEVIGKPSEGRKMKLQGVLSSNCKVDIQKHFCKPDFATQKMLEEREEERKRVEKEAKTTVGAVKRLIQRVSSLSVTDNLIVRGFDQDNVTPTKPKNTSRPRSPSSSVFSQTNLEIKEAGRPRVRRALTLNRGFQSSFMQGNNSKGESAIGERNSSINSNPNYTLFLRSQSRDAAISSAEKPSSRGKQEMDNLFTDMESAADARRNIASTDNLEGRETVQYVGNTHLLAGVDRAMNRHKISLRDVVPEDYREEVQSPTKRVISDSSLLDQAKTKKFTIQEQRNNSFLSGELLVQSEKSQFLNDTSISREEDYDNMNFSCEPTQTKPSVTAAATPSSRAKFFKTAAILTPMAKTSIGLSRQDNRKKTITGQNERSNQRNTKTVVTQDSKHMKQTRTAAKADSSFNRRKDHPAPSLSQLHKQIVSQKPNTRGKQGQRSPQTVRQPLSRRQNNRRCATRTARSPPDEDRDAIMLNSGGTTGETKNHQRADLLQLFPASRKGQSSNSHLFNNIEVQGLDDSNQIQLAMRPPHLSLQSKQSQVPQIISPMGPQTTQADVYNKWGTGKKKHKVKQTHASIAQGGTASLSRRNKLMKGAYIFEKAIILAPTINSKRVVLAQSSTLNSSRSQKAALKQGHASQQQQSAQQRVKTNPSRATPITEEDTRCGMKLDRLANTYFDGRSPREVEDALRSNSRSPGGVPNGGSTQDWRRPGDRSRSSQLQGQESPDLKTPAHLKQRRKKIIRRRFQRNAVSLTKEDERVGEMGGSDREENEKVDNLQITILDDEERLAVTNYLGTRSPNLTQRRRPDKLNLVDLDPHSKLFAARTPAQTSRTNRRLKDHNYMTAMQNEPNRFTETQGSSRKTIRQSRVNLNTKSHNGSQSYAADQSVRTAQLVYLGGFQQSSARGAAEGDVKLPKIGEKGSTSVATKDRYSVYQSRQNQPQPAMIRSTTASRPGAKFIKAVILQKSSMPSERGKAQK